MLGPAVDVCLDAAGLEVLVDPVDDLVQVHVALRGPVGDQPDDLVVALGVEGGEGQVLQLPLDRVHAQPVSQRRQHLQRLAGLALLLGRRQEAQRAHVVQPVGQLDHQHPRIAGHRHDHLADRLGLGRLAVLDLVQLGDALDQVRHLVAELGLQLLDAQPGVLHRVVQQRGDQRGGVHAEFGQDGGHRQRMGDVRVAGLAQLAPVPLLGQVVAALQQPDVHLRMGRLVHREQRLQHRLDAGLLAGRGDQPAGDPVTHPASVGALRLDDGLAGRLVEGSLVGGRLVDRPLDHWLVDRPLDGRLGNSRRRCARPLGTGSGPVGGPALRAPAFPARSVGSRGRGLGGCGLAAGRLALGRLLTPVGLATPVGAEGRFGRTGPFGGRPVVRLGAPPAQQRPA